MRFEVPQWLPQAFVRAAQAAGSQLPKEELVAACGAILERWSSPDRIYHGVQHLIDTAAMLETLIPETHSPDLVRLAAWYHGVVFSTSASQTYTRNGGEDEAASADFAYADLVRLGVGEKKAKRVATLVRGIGSSADCRPADTSQFEVVDIDLLALRDAHMGTLSVEPQRYKKYTECVRKEYLHIPTGDFLRARRNVIEHLLDRAVLFVTPLAHPWEERTRENLNAELIRINAKLAALGSEASGVDSDAQAAIAAKAPEGGDPFRLVPTAEDPRMGGPAAGEPPTLEFPAISPPTAASPIASASTAGSPSTATFPALSEGPATGKIRAYRKNAKDAFSSLEACGERFDPGERAPANLTPEQAKQRKREQLAAEARRRIENRHQACGEPRSPERSAAPTVPSPAAPASSPASPDSSDFAAGDEAFGGPRSQTVASRSVGGFADDSHAVEGLALPGWEAAPDLSATAPTPVSAATPPSVEALPSTAATPPSASTPEWVEEDPDSPDAPVTASRLTDTGPFGSPEPSHGVPSSGMEREPDL